MGTMVTFFFSGFVMGRVPFGLSPRFRPMLQRGVDLASLDVAYFTGLSYYIMLLFASQGPFSLAFADATVDQAQLMMRQQMAMGAPGPGGARFVVQGVWVVGWGVVLLLAVCDPAINLSTTQHQPFKPHPQPPL